MADSNHLLEQNPKIRAEQITNRENRDSEIKEVVEKLKHACECMDSNCTNVDCDKMKRSVLHFNKCSIPSKDNCKTCRYILDLSWYHATRTQDCESSHCLIPCCTNIKHALKLKVNVASSIQLGGDNVFGTQVGYSVEQQAGRIPQALASVESQSVLQPLPPEMFNTGGGLLPLQELQQRRPEESQYFSQLAAQIIQAHPIGPVGTWTHFGPVNHIWPNWGLPLSQMGPIGAMSQLGSMSSMGPMYQMGPLGQIQPGRNLTNPQNAPNKEALQQLPQKQRSIDSLVHKMKKLGLDMDDGSSSSDQKEVNPQAARELLIRGCIHSLVHACQCRDASCRLTNCQRMKRVMTHTKICKRKNDGCQICKQLLALCYYHAKYCQETKCGVLFCSTFKLQRRLQHFY